MAIALLERGWSLCLRGIALLSFAFYLSSASGLVKPMNVKFRKAGQSMIIVPVMINGAGPFDFLLDTGSSSSMVDQKLVEELHLPFAGRTVLESPYGQAVTPVVHTNSLGMANATVASLDLVILDNHAGVRPKVRGVLGEDFLRYFDVFIDYGHRLIQFESGPGPLRNRLIGEHLPFSANGSGEEKLNSNLLVIMGHFEMDHFDAFRTKDAKLLLDSGTPYLLLCSQVTKAEIPGQPESLSVSGLLGSSFEAYAQTAHLQLGKRFLSGVTVVVPIQNTPARDVDGLLPTSLFRSVFISHSGKFVILDPSAKPAVAQSELPSHADTDIPEMQPPHTD